jgi:hypothetical protein
MSNDEMIGRGFCFADFATGPLPNPMQRGNWRCFSVENIAFMRGIS